MPLCYVERLLLLHADNGEVNGREAPDIPRAGWHIGWRAARHCRRHGRCKCAESGDRVLVSVGMASSWQVNALSAGAATDGVKATVYGVAVSMHVERANHVQVSRRRRVAAIRYSRTKHLRRSQRSTSHWLLRWRMQACVRRAMGRTRSHGRRDDPARFTRMHPVAGTTMHGMLAPLALQEHMLTLSGTERLLERSG